MFMIVISECKLAAKILGSEVYCITDTQFLPFSNIDGLDMIERQNLDKATMEFRKWLQGNAFYFSYSYDITTRAQETAQEEKGTQMWARSDIRFFWNRRIL